MLQKIRCWLGLCNNLQMWMPDYAHFRLFKTDDIRYAICAECKNCGKQYRKKSFPYRWVR